jgi:hypothetical protein
MQPHQRHGDESAGATASSSGCGSVRRSPCRKTSSAPPRLSLMRRINGCRPCRRRSHYDAPEHTESSRTSPPPSASPLVAAQAAHAGRRPSAIRVRAAQGLEAMPVRVEGGDDRGGTFSTAQVDLGCRHIAAAIAAVKMVHRPPDQIDSSVRWPDSWCTKIDYDTVHDANDRLPEWTGVTDVVDGANRRCWWEPVSTVTCRLVSGRSSVRVRPPALV